MEVYQSLLNLVRERKMTVVEVWVLQILSEIASLIFVLFDFPSFWFLAVCTEK